ncbi:MAG: NinG protein [Bacteriophage sp.]|nr:MAG: NinG protein [Bacteriophage sp.]
MKDYNNSPFYNSKAWKRASAAYMASKHYICERCGRPAQICHHKIYLNGTNVHDPAIALSFDNLEALCLDCHNAEHGPKHSVTLFDKAGNVAAVKETPEIQDFKRQQEAIEGLLERLKKK